MRSSRRLRSFGIAIVLAFSITARVVAYECGDCSDEHCGCPIVSGCVFSDCSWVRCAPPQCESICHYYCG